jgi:hypothetical protein
MNTQLCMNVEKIDAKIINLESPVILALASICYQLESNKIKGCSDLLLMIARLPSSLQEKTIQTLLHRTTPVSPFILNVISICVSTDDNDMNACGEILLAMSELSGPLQEMVIKSMLDRAKPNWI